MFLSLLQTAKQRSSLLTTQNRSEILTRIATPEQFKQLWILIISNIFVIACLGGILVMMGKETAHLILAVGITLSASTIVGVAGYICWLVILSTKHRTYVNFYQIFEWAPMGIILLDNEAHLLACNHFFREQIFQNTPLEERKYFLDLLQKNCREEIAAGIKKVASGEPLSLPIEISFEGQTNQVLSAFISQVRNYTVEEHDSQKSSGIILHFIDNSEQKKLHLQLVQSQKMQAMGQLAGGIAHDFNNLLTAMIGFCDLLLMRHLPGDQSFTDIMQIQQNANRAANLVRQLLAFSKQQTLQPQILNVVDTLSELSVLLERLVGVNIELKITYERDLGLIKVDRGQFEQVIINLVVNGRDAMNGQGELSIKAFNKTSEKPFSIGHEVLLAGSYVVIEITDTGSGIKKEHLSRIFDPFFSTKAVGQGTGLGLSTVYGIVKQTGGHIFVESTVGKGTKFNVILPYHGEQDDTKILEIQQAKKPNGDLTGTGRILFVEDEDAVRLFGTRALRDKGYDVVEARNGEEALKYIISIIDKQEDKLDLLITDVVMPTLDGPTLAKKAHEIFPDLKVIYISGYAEDSFRQRVGKEKGIAFLPKPFSLKELGMKVKETIGSASEISLLSENTPHTYRKFPA